MRSFGPAKAVSQTVAQSGADQQVLIGRIRAGDTSALDEVYIALAPGLWQFAYRRVGSWAIAEELVQDVFVSVWIRRESLVVSEALAAYLHGAVSRRVAEWRRHERTSERYAAALGSADAPGQHFLSPDEVLRQKDLNDAIAAALSTLSPRQRTLLTLRWKWRLDYQEIARRAGMSVGAAKTAVSRAQAALRPYLKQLLDR